MLESCGPGQWARSQDSGGRGSCFSPPAPSPGSACLLSPLHTVPGEARGQVCSQSLPVPSEVTWEVVGMRPGRGTRRPRLSLLSEHPTGLPFPNPVSLCALTQAAPRAGAEQRTPALGSHLASGLRPCASAWLHHLRAVRETESQPPPQTH